MTEYFKEREVVIPGQLLSDDPKKAGKWTYVYGGRVYAAVTGIAKIKDKKVHVIAAKGPYKPSEGDAVVGVLIDIKPSVAEVDLGWHLVGMIRIQERGRLNHSLHIGDVVYTTVKYSGVRGVFLDERENLRKIERGMLIWMSPVKVPRLISRKGGMLSILRKETGCSFFVGRNGLIAILGPDSTSEFVAASAIRLIERESHIQGLANKVTYHVRKLMLREGVGHDSEERDKLTD